MSQEWGQITVYDPSMAAQIAQMFNDFDELWPGGFSGGIPYDEQRVRDWLDDTSAIADLIAVDAQGAPVGYCGLYPHWRDEHAAYVSILGVVPRVKGQKYGKRMLQTAIETAIERGIGRVDLHTWSGNLNAVPLYKKIGMMWMPETSVYMQDYVPALAQTSLGQGWFAKHPDWYANQKRELAQAPDKYDDDGFELYTYSFEAGEDRLVGEIDRYGWGICGIKRTLDGETLAVKTRLREHNILVGLPNEMTIAVDNHTGRDLDLALAVEPFKGLQWAEPFPLSISVPDGTTASVSRGFAVDRTANARYDAHEASDTIRTRVIFEGQVVDLVTGGKIRPAVRVTSAHSYQVAPVGGTAELALDLVNHARQALRGTVDVFVEGVAGSGQQFPFALEAEERSGLVAPVPVSADPRDTVRVVHAVATVDVEGASGDSASGEGAPAAMPAHRLSLVADTPDLAVVVPANDGKDVKLLTDVFDIHAELEGRRVIVERRTLPGVRRRFSFQAGPPFGISLDGTLKYSYEVRREDCAATLVLRAASRQFPDLQIEKYTRVRPGVREVEHWVTVTNLRVDGPHTVGGRLGTGGGGGFSLNPFRELSRTFTPCGTGSNGADVIECDGILPLVSDTMVSQAPADWPETWTAAQTLTLGDYVANFWRPDGIAKVKVYNGMLSELEAEPRTLAPGERAELFHAWYGFSYNSLPDVRGRWSQLVGRVEIPRDERFRVPTVPPIKACWVGENVVVRGSTARKTVELAFATSFPLPGELTLKLPDGWQGAFLTADGPQPTLAMPDPTPGAPAQIEVELTVPGDAPDVALVQLHFSSAFEIDFDLPLLTIGEGEVTVERQALEGGTAGDIPIYAVSNGILDFAVLDGLSGSLIRLHDAQGRGYLFDNAPQVQPWHFFENHVGGLQPFCAGMHLEMIFAELDPIRAEPVEDRRWKGVEVAWTAYKDEHLRGQQFRLATLTLPGSNLLRVRVRHHNPTPRRVEWFGGLTANLALGGEVEGTVVHAPGGRGTWIRNPRAQGLCQPGPRRAAVGQRAQGRAVDRTPQTEGEPRRRVPGGRPGARLSPVCDGRPVQCAGDRARGRQGDRVCPGAQSERGGDQAVDRCLGLKEDRTEYEIFGRANRRLYALYASHPDRGGHRPHPGGGLWRDRGCAGQGRARPGRRGLAGLFYSGQTAGDSLAFAGLWHGDRAFFEPGGKHLPSRPGFTPACSRAIRRAPQVRRRCRRAHGDPACRRCQRTGAHGSLSRGVRANRRRVRGGTRPGVGVRVL